jgi:hypothetical protein
MPHNKLTEDELRLRLKRAQNKVYSQARRIKQLEGEVRRLLYLDRVAVPPPPKYPTVVRVPDIYLSARRKRFIRGRDTGLASRQTLHPDLPPQEAPDSSP